MNNIPKITPSMTIDEVKAMARAGHAFVDTTQATRNQLFAFLETGVEAVKTSKKGAQVPRSTAQSSLFPVPA